MFIKMWQNFISRKKRFNGKKFVHQNGGEDIKFLHLLSNLN